MLKKFLSGLGLLLALNLLIKPIWIFGIDRTVQNITGTDYGFYYSIFNFSILFSIFLDLGITGFNNRQVSQNNDLLKEHFSGMLIVKLMLSVLYALIMIVVGYIIGYNHRQMHLLFYLGVIQFMASLILFLRSNISALLLFKTESLFSVLDKLLMIVICSVLIWGHVLKGSFFIERFVYAQLLAYCVTAVMAFMVVLRHSPGIKFRIEPGFSMAVIKKGLPYAVLMLLMLFYSRIDSVMLERLLPDGVKQVAIYANAFRLLEAFNVLPYLFSILLLPLYAKMLSEHVDISSLVRVSLALLFPIAIMVAMTSLFYSKELMGLLYVNHIDQSAQVFSVLMFSFVSISIMFVFGSLLTANGSMRILNRILFLAMVINVVLNLVLIPPYKALGATWAGVVTQAFVAVSEMIVAIRIIPVKMGPKFIPALILFGFLIAGVAFLARYIPVNWFVQIMMIGLMGSLLALLLRLIDFKTIRLLYTDE
jgi:O-antigen/teichoic acid export membrane protein